MTKSKMDRWLPLLLLPVAVVAMARALEASSVECPWYRDPRFQELGGVCACSGGAGAEASSAALSVHCQFVKVRRHVPHRHSDHFPILHLEELKLKPPS